MITETPGIILVTDIEKVFIEGAMVSHNLNNPFNIRSVKVQ